MAKSGMSKFMDLIKLSDPEEDLDDDLFLDDDDDYYEPPKKKGREKTVYDDEDDFEETTSFQPKKQPKQKNTRATSPSKLVSINSRNNNSNRGSNQVYVIKPQEFNEAQKVTDFLKEGRTIVINMEGIEVHAAQRIIDFIGGACYALDGSLQAISANIFIAAPSNIDVSGDLRDEILNESTLAPNLGSY